MRGSLAHSRRIDREQGEPERQLGAWPRAVVVLVEELEMEGGRVSRDTRAEATAEQLSLRELRGDRVELYHRWGVDHMLAPDLDAHVVSPGAGGLPVQIVCIQEGPSGTIRGYQGREERQRAPDIGGDTARGDAARRGRARTHARAHAQTARSRAAAGQASGAALPSGPHLGSIAFGWVL